jgi:ABC-type uncharacterized transport system permease subunit
MIEISKNIEIIGNHCTKCIYMYERIELLLLIIQPPFPNISKALDP